MIFPSTSCSKKPYSNRSISSWQEEQRCFETLIYYLKKKWEGKLLLFIIYYKSKTKHKTHKSLRVLFENSFFKFVRQFVVPFVLPSFSQIEISTSQGHDVDSL